MRLIRAIHQISGQCWLNQLGNKWNDLKPSDAQSPRSPPAWLGGNLSHSFTQSQPLIGESGCRTVRLMNEAAGSWWKSSGCHLALLHQWTFGDSFHNKLLSCCKEGWTAVQWLNWANCTGAFQRIRILKKPSVILVNNVFVSPLRI